MKKLAYLFVALIALIGIAVAQKSAGAVISAQETDFDFGVIKEANGKVSHTFIIKNAGTAPLVITRVVAACGCTTPQYSTEPIAPNKSTEIKVTYDPSGRPGQFVKNISVYSNGRDGTFTLRIKGVVE